ncbi:GIY-YIG nuclease family protein [Arenibacter certesii]|uniref:Excinuclease cho n=1 Tax=Arenibacter certesii TaxID=228955 RepID=A0A918MMJ1_9FLAO|nr:GIY-YIG nuclease family protein [Arenibacter certesii]GGW36621.1 exonuclease [Arenibacter certesii]
MLGLAILTIEDGTIISEFESFVKVVPHLSKSERAALNLDYSKIRSAPTLSDIAPEIIEIIENTHTVFIDQFSCSIFKKAFREIGYPAGSANIILEKAYKNYLKSTTPFSLYNAMELLKIQQPLHSLRDICLAMEKILDTLNTISSDNNPVLSSMENERSDGNEIDFSHLPKSPGVYFFKDYNDQTIYIGKAKNISKRVRSHFTSRLKFELELCRQTTSIDFEETGSEVIALLLEAHYIHSLKPKYNTLQKEIIDPYIITSKMDSKGVLRIQLVQKSYSDNQNEFYYNRTSVLQKVKEVQQKFNLCNRYAGIERTSNKCNDPIFCKGICEGKEDKQSYNQRVHKALDYIFAQRPSYILKLRGRSAFEESLVLVKNGIYQGFGFIDKEANINSIADIESFIKYYPHNYFTARILDQYFKNTRPSLQNVIRLT